MKKDKPSKKKVKPIEDTFQYLEEHFKNSISTLKKNCQLDIRVRDKTLFLKAIVKKSPEQIINLSSDVNNILESLNALKSPLKIPDRPATIIVNLMSLLSYKDFTIRPEMRFTDKISMQYRDNFLALCYWIIHAAISYRLLSLFDDTSRDVFYIRAADILEKDYLSLPELERAKKDLSKYTRNIYKKQTGKYVKPEETISFVWEAATKALPEDLKKRFLLAIKGDKSVRYVPKRAADRLRKKKQTELEKTKGETSIDSPRTPSSDITPKDTLDGYYVTPEEHIELLENQKLIDECLKLMKDILTDREKQVLSMRYPLKGEQATLEETGKELGIRKQTVHEIEKNALNKLKSHSKRKKIKSS